MAPEASSSSSCLHGQYCRCSSSPLLRPTSAPSTTWTGKRKEILALAARLERKLEWGLRLTFDEQTAADGVGHRDRAPPRSRKNEARRGEAGKPRSMEPSIWREKPICSTCGACSCAPPVSERTGCSMPHPGGGRGQAAHRHGTGRAPVLGCCSTPRFSSPRHAPERSCRGQSGGTGHRRGRSRGVADRSMAALQFHCSSRGFGATGCACPPRPMVPWQTAR
jgi:hypothetical protein